MSDVLTVYMYRKMLWALTPESVRQEEAREQRERMQAVWAPIVIEPYTNADESVDKEMVAVCHASVIEPEEEKDNTDPAENVPDSSDDEQVDVQDGDEETRSRSEGRASVSFLINELPWTAERNSSMLLDANGIPPKVTLSACTQYEMRNNLPKKRIMKGVESARWNSALLVSEMMFKHGEEIKDLMQDDQLVRYAVSFTQAPVSAAKKNTLWRRFKKQVGRLCCWRN